MHDEKTLLKLQVLTESGHHLGRLSGFEYDDASQAIVRYKVRAKGLAARIVKSPLIIAREQVVRIDGEKMIVEDNVEREMETAAARAMGLVESEPS